jgi:hypothetical protein
MIIIRLSSLLDERNLDKNRNSRCNHSSRNDTIRAEIGCSSFVKTLTPLTDRGLFDTTVFVHDSHGQVMEKPMTATLVEATPEVVLSSSPIPQLRRLRVESTDVEVVITGQVPSYYLKQLAQETVRPALGTRRLQNRVEVLR